MYTSRLNKIPDSCWMILTESTYYDSYDALHTKFDVQIFTNFSDLNARVESMTIRGEKFKVIEAKTLEVMTTVTVKIRE